MTIEMRELTKPTTNQMQKSNFKNQQLEAKHTPTTNQTYLLLPISISSGAPIKQ